MDEAMEYNDIENDQEDVAEVVDIGDAEAENPVAAPPEAQEDDEPDNGQIAPKKGKWEEEECKEKPGAELEDDADAGELCPICMDVWSNAGEHRLCSLRCGHLFGHSCVLKWLQIACNAGNRRCPQCNRKAAVRDIRILYARKLSVVDTAEVEKLRKELADVTAEKKRLEVELSKCQLRQKIYEQHMETTARRMQELERRQTDMGLRLNETSSAGGAAARVGAKRKFYLEKTVNVSTNSHCRVLDYNSSLRCLAVSQKSERSLFPGFGVVKIDVESLQPTQFSLLHTQAIRDIGFHPTNQTLMMSVSFDKTVKMLDARSNVVVHGYTADSQLWSGCWSRDNEHTLLVGGQNGSVTEFDTRQTSGAIGVHASPGDRSPVASLAAVPANSAAGIPRGGFIVTHLNTCYAYELKEVGTWAVRQMYLEGPHMSVRYDPKNHHALISSRTNARTPNARHTVFTIERGDEESLVCNVIHTFNGGHSQKLLSRPCHVNLGDDTLVALHQESTSSIPLWSISSGQQIHSIPVSDPVIDMCSFDANNTTLLATLSANKLRLYNYG